MAMQSPFFSSSSFSYGFSFDVFISFRGADTRSGFTGNLYKALCDKGIRTFIDNKELQRGDEITPSLLKSIEHSRIAIIVFSENYATSSFCLDELVHIINYFKEKGRLVLPVFYGVEPSHVRHLNDSYGEALAEFEERFHNNKEYMERLQKWKIALHQAANLSGFHFKKEEYEYEFIKKIVTEISNKIKRVLLEVADHLVVGHESQLLQVKSLLDVDCDNEVCMIGIYGTGGLGKSTLARAVYNLIADQFEGWCFLHNVRENSNKYGLEYLQEQLLYKSIGLKIKLGDISEGIPIIKQRLHTKKVLLILDDVNELNQLKVLVGDPGWLGRGSRVIITTRDKKLLSDHGIEKIYEAVGLNKEEALELLRNKTFESNKNDSSYGYILNRAVKYASGLPLALEVVGSNLFGKSIADCESTLDKYERIPHKDIQKILKVSYDALDEEQQSVFLNIACFFKEHRKVYVQEILHAHYGYCIESHIGVLVDKSLIKIKGEYDGSVTLHDLIEDMGIEIIRQESTKEPGERSRLWCLNDIVDVLQENKGTSKIEMIYLNCPPMEPIDMDEKAFKKMTNLKTLIIEKGHFSKCPKYLPSSLRVLEWKGFSSESLSSCFSNKKKFNNIKILTLDFSEYLTYIPDVSGLQNLEKLSFQDCHSLIMIHNSVGYLNKLEILNAICCSNLESFPSLQLPSLKELGLNECSSLKNFPELLCKMANIKEIVICETSIEDFPCSFGNLSELCRLVIISDNFKILPECLSECQHLVDIDIDYCMSLEEIRGIPPNLKELSAIECESLSSSSRRMLLSQKLHEAGGTFFHFSNGTEGIPDWFEHQMRGDTVSFWFRKKIPSLTCIIVIPAYADLLEFNLFLNDNKITLPDFCLNHDGLTMGHAFLFDLILDQCINKSFERNPELYEAFRNNEWNYVELNCKMIDESDTEEDDSGDTEEEDHVSDTKEDDLSDTEEEDHVSDMEEGEKEIKILRSGAQMGIHVSWEGGDFSDTEEKSNKEGDVRFTNPYSKRKKFRRMLKKQREEILHRRSLEKTKSEEGKSLEVSETENLQQQDLAFLSSGIHNLVLAETKEMHRFVEMGVSETETVQRCSFEETMSDEDKSLEVSETETVEVILSFAQMGIHEK